MANESEPYRLPKLRDNAGFRLNDQDRKNLNILLRDRRETNVSKLLRDLAAEAAAPVRERWKEAAKRIAAQEDDAS